jgi:predicted P-loop ATPase
MRKFAIATAQSRKSTIWKNQQYTLDQLHKAITKTFPTSETHDEFMDMTQKEQVEIKDVGGFVGGHLWEGRRRAGYCQKRSMITLDADYAKPELDFIMEHFYNCRAWLYSTHKHTDLKPRLRLVIPLARDVDADEYVAVAVKIMETLGPEQFDRSSYQPERLMFWCSHPTDIKPVVISIDGDLMDPDKVLQEYGDWRDSTLWGVKDKPQAQGNPLEKPGIVGAFCRSYDIIAAMDTFLPGVYKQEKEDRYTYAKGSSYGGLVIYDGGLYAYSNHATDPAGLRLVNAFDLIRLHRFSDLDVDTPPDVPVNRLPSYVAMQELALQDEQVKTQIATEKLIEAGEDFADKPIEWLKKLTFEKSGKITSNAKNLDLIFEHDPNLQGLVYLDEFTSRFILTRNPVWNGNGDYWSDFDNVELRIYLDNTYGITGRDKVRDALIKAAKRAGKHPIKDYLDGIEWDGVPRLDSMLIDYLGAADNEYTRAVTRKHMVAAVKRVYEPGCKYDHALICAGPQGIGKTLCLVKLGGRWFSNSLDTIKGNAAYEAIEGAWIVELGEMMATKKADVEAVKHFISKQEDRFRRAYGEMIEYKKRQCCFWGSTNEREFLYDKTGNRRFWVVHCAGHSRYKVWDMKQETVDQIWAEAVIRYGAGEDVWLDERITKMAIEIQETFTAGNELTGLITEFLDDEEARKDRTCVAEIIEECLNGELATFPLQRKNDVRAALDNLPGWERYAGGKNLRFGNYGTQKAWVRVT